jgi:hypothetical protein
MSFEKFADSHSVLKAKERLTIQEIKTSSDLENRSLFGKIWARRLGIVPQYGAIFCNGALISKDDVCSQYRPR